MRDDQVSLLSKVTPRERTVSTHKIGSPVNGTGQGFWIRLWVNSIAVLFEMLIAILHPLSQRCKSLKQNSRQLTRRSDLQDGTGTYAPCPPNKYCEPFLRGAAGKGERTTTNFSYKLTYRSSKNIFTAYRGDVTPIRDSIFLNMLVLRFWYIFLDFF
jgi:heme exporter protein D